MIATLPVASLVVLFGACSSESLPSGGEQHAPGAKTGATLPQVSGVELDTKPSATQRFARVSKQFFRAPQVEPEAKPYNFPAGVVPPKDLPKHEPIPARPVLTKGDAKGFVRQGERFRAQIDEYLKEKTLKPATVDLPATADGFVRVQPDGSKVGVEFATQHANDKAEIEVAEGTAAYPSGAPEGGDILYRVTADSVEDYVLLDKKPAKPRVDYRVNVSEVAGLRLYDNVLEFLDAKGEPQIRVKPPRVIDTDGVVHEAFVKLDGCKYDTSPQLPMDRPLTAPGAKECSLSVTWDDTNVIYPAIVDPVWATAGSLAVARYRAAAVRLSDGKVMTCGGIGDIGIAIKSCEVYTPVANGAGSWVTGPAMTTARNDHALFVLSPASTDVLAVGGNGLFTSERTTAALGPWAASTGDFSAVTGCPGCNPYFYPQMPAMTSDGQYVVLVDYQAAPYVYKTSTNTWSNGTANPSPQQQYRYSSMLLQIPGQGMVLRLGGNYSSTTYATGERYKPSTDTWSNSASMTVPRSDAAIAILDASHVMVYGGYTGAAYSSTAEIYNATGNSWAFTTGPIPNGGSAGQYNRGVTWAFHGSGKMLSNTDQGMYLYDPTAASAPWSALQPNGFNNIGSQANVVSAGTRVLMVPVWPNGGASGAQTACRLFDFGDKGSQCSATVECQAGLTCVKDYQYDYYGVCCDSACSGACQACTATHKESGVGDGICGGRKKNEYVGDTACPYTDPSTCGTSGYYCDGAGACAKWSNTTQCGAGSCADGDTQNNARLCDGNGTCQQQTSTDCSTGYQCNFGACQTSCYNQTDYCGANYYCQDFKVPYYTCNLKKGNGTACQVSYECSSNNCIDGVCCDKACNGLCEACTKALTGGTDGTCKSIAAGSDPQNECPDNGAGLCGTNGSCNGASGCQLYSNGTVCQAASCATATSRNVPDTCNGTGTCTDQGTQNCATGYACVAGACQTSCTDDTQCASAYYCDTVAKQCVADKTQGQACPRDAACTGNANCVDGVCCDSACTGTCRSCLKNRTGLATDGTCGNILDDTDPENECAIDVGYPASCKAPGLCTGGGTCRVYAKPNTVAKPDTCSGTTLSAYTCDGAGNLTQVESSCYPYKCNAGGTACRVACTEGTAKTDCDDSSFCKDGKCVGQLPLGSACTDGGQCKSSFCADIGKGKLEGDPDPDPSAGGDSGVDNTVYPGVCCDAFCGSKCMACKKSTKGQGSDGACENVADNYDLKDDCSPDPTNPCGLTGECDGKADCRKAQLNTSCGISKCVGNQVLGQVCDGKGFCVNKENPAACTPYVCRDVNGAEQCTSPCADDNDCEDSTYCDNGSCKKKKAPGATCDSSGICASGFCVDGVCCDVSCKGQCEACDVAGSEGVCSPVQGIPHNMRPACDHAGDECGGQCDGVNSNVCKYAAVGTACGTTTCDNGLAKSSTCNGQGECKSNKDEECSPYACGPDDSCLSRCEQDADCSDGYTCNESNGRCLPANATCSKDRLSSEGNGQSTPCKPFLCVPATGTCAVSCAFSTDCAPDFVCEPSSKTCLPAPADTGGDDTGSCACRAAGATPNRTGYWALAALGVAFTGLRRRRSGKAGRAVAKRPRLAPAPHPFE
ncbi:MAG TPA: Dickkopf N-terminal cysteine-rich domain-containing protein [Polyangiaceae bacterium]|nr:Dickkopf N-terminal cysteine-rich domain-containing protein [Polyangiaceae bacterium]